MKALVLVLWRLAVLWLLVVVVYFLALIAYQLTPEEESDNPPAYVEWVA